MFFIPICFSTGTHFIFSFFAMLKKAAMGTMRHNFKIFYSVIGPVAIFMVNVFFRAKLSIKMLLHDMSMFKNKIGTTISVLCFYTPITLMSKRISYVFPLANIDQGFSNIGKMFGGLLFSSMGYGNSLFVFARFRTFHVFRVFFLNPKKLFSCGTGTTPGGTAKNHIATIGAFLISGSWHNFSFLNDCGLFLNKKQQLFFAGAI